MRQTSAAVAGFGFVALLIVIFALVGSSAPTLYDSAGSVVGYLHGKRTEILVSATLLGLALVLFLVFLGGIVSLLRAAGEEGLGLAAFGGGILLFGLVLIGNIVPTSLAFKLVDDVPPAVAKALYEPVSVAFVLLPFPAAAVVAASSVAAWRARLFNRRFGLLGCVAALLIAAGGARWARHGFYSPDGGYGKVVLGVFGAWVLAVSLWLVARGREPAL